MNPLFPNFYRALKEEALSQFSRTGTGRILKEIDTLARSRSGNSSGLKRLTRELISNARRGGFSSALAQGELGQAMKKVQRYASNAAKDAALESMFRALGPLGELFRSLMRPKRGTQTPIQKEIQAARTLLEVFRPDLLKRPAAPLTTRLPANLPPRKPLSTIGPGAPVYSSRFEMPPDVAEAQKLLEAMGFTVTPPGKKPPRDTAFVTTQAGDRVALKTRGEKLPYRPDDPILTGAMVKVESSNVHSIGYIFDHDDPAQGVLKVRFWQSSRKDKTQRVAGPMYFYYKVPPDVFQAFRIAASKGKFVWDRLRVRGTVSGHQYQYELKGIAQEYVPRKAARFGPNEYFVSRRVSVKSLNGNSLGPRESELPDRLVGPYLPRSNSSGGTRGARGPRGPRSR